MHELGRFHSQTIASHQTYLFENMQNCLETFIFTLFQRRYSELIHENLRELGLNVELAAEC